MLKSISTFLLLFLSLSLFAQDKFKISGVVYDDSGEPLPFCKAILKVDDELKIGALTDIDGKFILSPVEPGTYQLEIHYIGYETLIQKVKVTNKDLTVDLGLLQMQSQDVLLKPIIYLYPEDSMDVEVKLNYDGQIIFSYPKYPEDGWNVSASPDGNLINENGQEYYGLFWEGTPNQPLTIASGAVVKGEETVAFLEESLEQLGLNRREAMEFIVFWQPRMEINPYNLIHFSTNEYEEIAELEITPKPESVIRVMMVYQPLSHPIDIEAQDLTPLKKERKGFTVVEWGGTESKVELSSK